jgi:DNA-directed RNA polymerase specialized sigma24 family protein
VSRAFARIPERCQQLLRLLTVDPPLAYDAVAAAIGRPIGSIGPTRARCLDQLRQVLGLEGLVA